MLMKRMLGCSEIETSAMGFGCWAIGGPFLLDQYNLTSINNSPLAMGLLSGKFDLAH